MVLKKVFFIKKNDAFFLLCITSYTYNPSTDSWVGGDNQIEGWNLFSLHCQFKYRNACTRHYCYNTKYKPFSSMKAERLQHKEAFTSNHHEGREATTQINLHPHEGREATIQINLHLHEGREAQRK